MKWKKKKSDQRKAAKAKRPDNYYHHSPEECESLKMETSSHELITSIMKGDRRPIQPDESLTRKEYAAKSKQMRQFIIGQARYHRRIKANIAANPLYVNPAMNNAVISTCMQILGEADAKLLSDMEGKTPGLGIFNVDVVKFSKKNKVPQIGWNKINKLRSPLFKNIIPETYVYLVHSYFAKLCSNTCAESFYGLNYSSALYLKNFYGVQFHPEKSSKQGSKILKNFMKL